MSNSIPVQSAEQTIFISKVIFYMCNSYRGYNNPRILNFEMILNLPVLDGLANDKISYVILILHFA